MTIEEAIKTLEYHAELTLVDKNPRLLSSVKIGIEALEYMLEARRTHCVPVNNMLLHETKE